MTTESASISIVTKKLASREVHVIGKNTERRNYLVARKPGTEVGIQVKGLQRAAPWLVRPAKVKHPNLFYTLVVLNPQRVFVLTQDQINRLIEEYRTYREEKWRRAGGPKPTDPLIGKSFLFRQAVKFEDKWDKLPGWK